VIANVMDPIKFKDLCWPELEFYKEQRDICYSVRDNEETFVPAGNELGKDFISAFICLWFFCSRRPARIVTTSPQSGQLEDVLWGEIRRFIDSSRYKLPLQYNHMKIRQQRTDGTLQPLAELVGRVTQKGEAMLGRHIPYGLGGIPTTLAVFDEASGMDNTAYETCDTWTHRKLIIGNPYPCTNFFFNGVKEGDKVHPVHPERFFRKIITIKAEHSPNVRLGFAQKASGLKPTNEVLVPGVVRYEDYIKRRALWGKVRQSIGLDAEFYEGAEEFLYPADWMERSYKLAAELGPRSTAVTIGVDPAEGGDNSAWAVCDMNGLIELISMKTPDTTEIPRKTLELMVRYRVKASGVYFDRGGGGKQHADFLRGQGHKVNTVAFGEAVTPPKKRGLYTMDKRKEQDEERYVYKNRRAEMYGLLRESMDPVYGSGFTIPREYAELLEKQMRPIPLMYDGEGRMFLPPKRKKSKDSKEVSLTELIGHSPDETDALVLARYGLTKKSTTFVIQSVRKH
jgi:hypothetical protein|tara:strand:- start:5399 stop:6931 length:1533 start_codon:yes stop_codon:yes gene_type:complete